MCWRRFREVRGGSLHVEAFARPGTSPANRETFAALVMSDNNLTHIESEEEERRTLTRRKIKVKKIFAAEVTLEGAPQHCFVHIHDLSEGGMRIHTDFSFPDDTELPLRLHLDEPLEVSVEKIWDKELIGGMRVLGLRFRKISESAQAKLMTFLRRYSPENKRKAFRLERILVVEMVLGSTKQKFGVFTLDLSTTGMRINHEFPLPEDMEIPFRILLEYDQPPIEVQARVSWQKENAFGQFLVGMEFTEISEQARQRIETFIDSAISGQMRAQRFATLENFDLEAHNKKTKAEEN